MHRALCCALLVGLGALTGCTPGEAVRPKDPTYAGATGETACTTVGEEGRPLVVDWKPEERSDLEAALAQGVAVVHYDCQGIKLLPDCHLDGTYGYVGTTTQEQVISLNNADEVKANLPLNGVKLSASLERGSSLDIGMLLVGKKTTTALKVNRAQLAGRCDGATHFVRDAIVGGFAMKTGTVGKVGAAVDIFGRGGGGSSESAKTVSSKSGDVDACKAADIEATKPPAQCGAPVRIRLLALSESAPAVDDGAQGKKGAKPTGAVKAKGAGTDELDALLASLDCPAGMVFTQGKCAAPAAAAVHTCKKGDVADCTAQCTANDALSCQYLGQIYYSGKGAAVDRPKAALYLDKACNAGQARACYYLGMNIAGMDNADMRKELAAFTTGCQLGDAEACNQQASCYDEGDCAAKDVPRAMRLYTRACNAGSKIACDNVGQNYLSGLGVPKDEALGLSFLERACFGGRYDACGEGDSDAEMKRNAQRHLRMADFACNAGRTGGCIQAAEALSPGGYASPDAAKAAKYRARACALNKNACKP